jgi:DNA-binding HxlR family transcriptional regulator
VVAAGSPRDRLRRTPLRPYRRLHRRIPRHPRRPLRKLEAAGIIERRQYSEHPPRHEYHVTEAGRELLPITLALSDWGDKWAVDTPFLTRRHSCGEPLQVDVVCHHCGRPVTHDTIHTELAAAGGWTATL